METFLGRFGLWFWFTGLLSVVFLGHLCEDNDPLDVLILMQEMAKAHKIPDYGWTMQNVNQWPSNNSKDHLEMIQERPYCRNWVKKRSKIIVEGLGVMEAYGKEGEAIKLLEYVRKRKIVMELID
ncbi:hypothetical protein ARALYDRAFT_893840 [Arabidopsis lyrata subsp. lyrata]|uniref:FBD domain-containing protein n=1 Tax=Arabidopsis lyrata subsp. lyrata TaxID=81972 RepID=D7KZ34_ARALL|nr:hypothetical protein ARALYDRAFT_893840 [Arabidopsis lyrata subsp. lyrata]